MIVQSNPIDSHAAIGFTVPQDRLEGSLEIAEKIAEKYGCQKVESNGEIAKLSVSGIGLRSHTGVAIGMFKALADAGINIQIMNTSEVRVNVIIDSADGKRGLESLQSAFSGSMH